MGIINKNIIIVTWMGEGNFGTCLQSYALCKKIESLGYNTKIITGFPHQIIFVSYIKYFFHLLGILKLKKIYNSLFQSRQEKKRKIFQKRSYTQLNLQTNNQVKELINETHCFVSGSDQIWNTYYRFDPVYFLSFAGRKKRVAYASSIGTDDINEVYKDEVRKLLMQFDHIGVREAQAVKVLSHLINRKDIRQVIDPTFLLTPDDWKAMAQNSFYEISLPEKYIFCYLIGNADNYKEQLSDVIDKTGIKDIIIIPAEENPDFTYPNATVYKDASPYEFVDLLQKSAFVCTDSFHASALSINTSKPFVEFLRFAENDKRSQNSRIYDLLSHYGLSDRIYSKEHLTWINPIEYDQVQSVLKTDREQSLFYLTDAIEN